MVVGGSYILCVRFVGYEVRWLVEKKNELSIEPPPYALLRVCESVENIPTSLFLLLDIGVYSFSPPLWWLFDSFLGVGKEKVSRSIFFGNFLPNSRWVSFRSQKEKEKWNGHMGEGRSSVNVPSGKRKMMCVWNFFCGCFCFVFFKLASSRFFGHASATGCCPIPSS